MDSNFLLGQAVDEAASAYNSAQAAVIWLVPHARELVIGWMRPEPRLTLLVQFEVPLKGGDTLRTFTVSPILQAADHADALLIVRGCFRRSIPALHRIAFRWTSL